MSKKDNFSQAMFEMFGLGKNPDEIDEEPDELEQLDTEAVASANELYDVVRDEPIIEERVVQTYVEEAPKKVVKPEPVEPAPAHTVKAADDFFDSFAHAAPVKRANCTYFAEGTSMEGTLRSDSDVEIVGDFRGEIASDGKVTIHSNTTSSIAAAELVLVDCTLTGDAMVSGDVSVNESSSVTGNIRASNVICSGVIHGNLTVQNNITLTENAQIVGDIKTGTLAMSRGAKVSGKIDMGS